MRDNLMRQPLWVRQVRLNATANHQPRRREADDDRLSTWSAIVTQGCLSAAGWIFVFLLGYLFATFTVR